MILNRVVYLLFILCVVLVNTSIAQHPKFVLKSNTIGDSIRYSVCLDIIDSLVSNKKIETLQILFDDKSDCYHANQENIVITSWDHTIVEPIILEHFVDKVKSKNYKVKRVYVKNKLDENFSTTEKLVSYSDINELMSIEISDPLETWEPLKLPILFLDSCSEYIGQSIKDRYQKCFNNHLSIPVKIISTINSKKYLSYYLFNYVVVIDEKIAKVSYLYKDRKELYSFFVK
jgi:hypothetical protein